MVQDLKLGGMLQDLFSLLDPSLKVVRHANWESALCCQLACFRSTRHVAGFIAYTFSLSSLALICVLISVAVQLFSWP
jgi:hypothetical protein